MATTAHSTISTSTVIEGTPIIKWVKPASTYKPGDWVYLSATATATHIDSDTAICKLIKAFLLEFKPRIVAFARKDCDDAYATTDMVPMIMGAKLGWLQAVGKITDPSGTKYPGHYFMASATAGDLAIIATPGDSNIVQQPVWNRDALANGDTYAKIMMW